MLVSLFKSLVVGGLEHVLFLIIYGIILPIDFFFQRGRYTTNQKFNCFLLVSSWPPFVSSMLVGPQFVAEAQNMLRRNCHVSCGWSSLQHPEDPVEKTHAFWNMIMLILIIGDEN